MAESQTILLLCVLLPGLFGPLLLRSPLVRPPLLLSMPRSDLAWFTHALLSMLPRRRQNPQFQEPRTQWLCW